MAFVTSLRASCEIQPNNCISNLKQVALGLLIYGNDYDDRFPAGRWYDELMPYTKTHLQCPQVPATQDSVGYAFNSRLERKKAGDIRDPDRTVLVFESSNLLRNASDPGVTLVPGGRHDGVNNVAHTDGAAKRIKWPDSPGTFDPTAPKG
jgi:hypothetical protein